MNHGFMPIVVEAKTFADYQQWIIAQKKNMGIESGTPSSKPKTYQTMTQAELMEQGKKIYESTCLVCHKQNGEGMPPAFPPLHGGKIATGPVNAHINIVLDGKPGTAMQAFKNQLTPEDIAAVITYERNSWGNNDIKKYGKQAGGIVQPTEVAKLTE